MNNKGKFPVFYQNKKTVLRSLQSLASIQIISYILKSDFSETLIHMRILKSEKI